MKTKSVALLALVLSGCSSLGLEEAETPKVCPQVAIVNDLARFEDYGRAEYPQPSDLVARAALLHVQSACHPQKDGIDVVFDIAMVAGRGAGLGGDRVEIPYFVSVTGQDNTVMAKEMMKAVVTFPDGEKTQTGTQKLHVMIPMGTAARGEDYRILVGFQLTPEQLARVRGEPAPAPAPHAAPVPKVERSK